VPTLPTYPGVYVEEIPSGVRTIAGVATAVAAFIDNFKRGPMNKAVRILDFGEFERVFGGLHAESEASYAIQQFFLNGGSQAWVVRVAAAGTAESATVTILDANGAESLVVEAIHEGEWGNDLRIGVDYPDPDLVTSST
jgi:phage tail sheath protein FI